MPGTSEVTSNFSVSSSNVDRNCVWTDKSITQHCPFHPNPFTHKSDRLHIKVTLSKIKKIESPKKMLRGTKLTLHVH